jgi:hypothetical protein
MGVLAEAWLERMEASWRASVRRRYWYRPRKAERIIAEEEERFAFHTALRIEDERERSARRRGRGSRSGEGRAE